MNRADVLLSSELTEQERLESLMTRRLGNRIRNLRVKLLPTGVILQGRAATYYAKQLAQHAAMELGQAPILANDIEVL
jgi:hypothetical protein